MDFTTAIGDAVDGGLALLTDNILVLLAIPAAFLTWKVGKKVVARLS